MPAIEEVAVFPEKRKSPGAGGVAEQIAGRIDRYFISVNDIKSDQEGKIGRDDVDTNVEK